MKIKLHPHFKRNYQKRIALNNKLIKQTQERITLFGNNPMHPLLKNHALTGSKRELRSFSVAGDIRIVYLSLGNDEVIFLDIGSHNQVY